jgi:Zn-dependent peptidase ImmA (M78 family)
LAIEYRQRLGWTAETRRKFDGKFREAFRWWRRTIEAQGVFCLEMRLDPNDVRGAALWCEGYPFILVNHQDIEAAAGRIFTLLHEFAHLIVTKEGVACDFQGVHGGSGGQNPEPFANRFAARILLTPDELRRRLESIGEARYREQWPDALLERIRKPFAASRDVVAILLQDIGLAPRGLYNEKREQWKSKRSWGRGGHRPPLQEQKLQEFGYSLAGVLAHSVAHPGFSWMDASSVLGLKVEKTQKFLAWADEHLT